MLRDKPESCLRQTSLLLILFVILITFTVVKNAMPMDPFVVQIALMPGVPEDQSVCAGNMPTLLKDDGELIAPSMLPSVVACRTAKSMLPSAVNIVEVFLAPITRNLTRTTR
jgi:hypothetical protein